MTRYLDVDDEPALQMNRHDLHIANYGFDIESRLTGAHETAHYSQFTYGVSNRGASVRIPWQVAIDKKAKEIASNKGQLWSTRRLISHNNSATSAPVSATLVSRTV